MPAEKGWEEKARKLATLAHGAGIKKILDTAYEILGNPIAMYDVSYNLLAYTENTVTDDVLWNELIALGTFSHESVDFFISEQFVESYAKTNAVVLLKSAKLKYDRAAAELFDKNGMQLANIIVLACYKPFAEEDFQLMETISECLSVELQNSDFYHKIGRIFEETMISNLIEGKNIDTAMAERTIDDLYTGLKANLRIAVIDMSEYEHTFTHLIYFQDLFKRIHSEFKYFIYLNSIVMIISTDSQMLNIEKDLSGLNEFFKKYRIFAGISSSFQNLMEIQEYYRQALIALNYGMDSGLDINIFMYDDFRLDHFINSMRGSLNIKELCNPLVFLMQEYDAKNGTDYLNVLYVYLLNGRNAAPAAKKLCIEEKELHCRLADAQEIFSLDWNNGIKLYSLVASLRILKCYC